MILLYISALTVGVQVRVVWTFLLSSIISLLYPISTEIPSQKAIQANLQTKNRILVQSDTVIDIILFVGHCDIFHGSVILPIISGSIK